MPELPEVENYRKYFDGTSLGRKVHAIHIDDTRILTCTEPELRTAVIGASFVKTDRIGKYMFAQLNHSQWVMIHMGMTGWFSYFNDLEDEPKGTRVRFDFQDGGYLAWVCRRKFGRIDLCQSLEAYVQKKKLGQDALKISFEDFAQSFVGKKTNVKALILKQNVYAGIGNWIADEMLYQSKINPSEIASSLSKEQLRVLYDKGRYIMETGIDTGVKYDRFPDHFLVRNERKNGHECFECGTQIEKSVVAGRGTFTCPKCQMKAK